ncbi:MAG: hypothetical protein Q4E76_06670 [Tissierellia bacterium]|nr:hypothetical protein [Tissierellia bacterium]
MNFAHIFSPGDCPVCGMEDLVSGHCCDSCRALMDPGVRLMEERLPHIVAGASIFSHTAAVREIYRRYKFGHEGYLYHVFGEMAAQGLEELGWEGKLVWIPTTPAKVRLRGYGPVERVAREVARLTGKNALDVLSFRRKVKDQIGLGRSRRWENLSGAFVSKRVSGPVILMDDLLTTGATAVNAARALREAGAEEIRLLVLMKAGALPPNP